MTPKEQAVVNALKERGGGIYSHELTAYVDGVSKSEIGGVVSSLVKKGVVVKDSFGPGQDFIELIAT
jgi:uncharacterized membrane protein